MDLQSLTIGQSQASLRAGEISAQALAEAHLARIDSLNPRLNAFITITKELALEQARLADEDQARGRLLGPLHGLPLALKDLFLTRGAPTTAGSRVPVEDLPEVDSQVYARLRAGGSVLLGKLNMHEWAFGITNENPHFGDCRNPWDPSRISGGSSGGAAAALASGMCLGAIGSDTGGSIRSPAALCGVAGLKPTYGRISLNGFIKVN